MLQKITVPFAQRIGIVIENGGSEDDGLKKLKKTRIATLSNICIVTKVWESGTAWYARELARGLSEGFVLRSSRQHSNLLNSSLT
jgi:hypothetical protein